ncbi:hypothetical protein SGHV127 [Glossina pallidipes salivary gland hypertrophy virus]|uniref:C2H2-type domain-containing protein n=1 Tax=Glossina hytrovirus (isolate Glossina pallidipes/Ethiopia/Seibersdorf/-) TaxID=379529 RepID=B0YLT1_GHVS|nr:hypothetical protein SGHV127 [Glossina pallidipes salivary gland hypertrophy virus]ABQ08900.1 hypothetical protein SGHV127 [Glossina pallidipes salivary gland hypertrophy virus]
MQEKYSKLLQVANYLEIFVPCPRCGEFFSIKEMEQHQVNIHLLDVQGQCPWYLQYKYTNITDDEYKHHYTCLERVIKISTAL